MRLKGDDLTRALPVVEYAQIIDFEVVDWNAVEVGCVKGEADLIDGDVKGVRIGGGRWGFRRLRDPNEENAHYREHHAERDGAFAPMTEHG